MARFTSCSGPAMSDEPSPPICRDWAFRSGWCPGANPQSYPGVEWRGADASDAAAATEAVQRRRGHLPVPERPVPQVDRAVSSAPTWRPDRSRAERSTAGQPGESLRLRPDRRRTHDRGPPARGLDRQGTDPGGHDPGAARCHGTPVWSISPSDEHRTSSEPGSPMAPPSASGSSATLVSGRRADFIGNPELPPHLQLRTRHRPGPGHPGHRRAGRGPGLAPSRTRNGDDSPHPRTHRRGGRPPRREPIGVQAGPPWLGSLQPSTAVDGGDDLPVRPALRARHLQVHRRFGDSGTPLRRPSPPPLPGFNAVLAGRPSLPAEVLAPSCRAPTQKEERHDDRHARGH